MLQLQDRGSMFLKAFAVDASCRGSRTMAEAF
jgi:hypothetical protein